MLMEQRLAGYDTIIESSDQLLVRSKASVRPDSDGPLLEMGLGIR